jgi:hypothetical protein
MAGFTYKLEHEDGTPADPPRFRAAVPNWRTGDTIALGRTECFESSTFATTRIGPGASRRGRTRPKERLARSAEVL